jgi:7-cyano-7-deazaguanine tRNA-ribosyltransferase
MFEIKARDGLARIGRFSTEHGNVETPTLLPVINPNRILISPTEMKELFGTEMVITNSYIIYKNEDLKKKALKGVHSLLDFDGAVMTDSGTFQSHVYGHVDVDPLEIVEFQQNIGSDVGTILDVFSVLGCEHNEAKKDVDETIRRAKESIKSIKDMSLACTVQGSIFPDLREYCALELSKLNCAVHPIGGVVPLLKDYRFKEIVEIIIASKKGLNASRPVHLFGAGHPITFGLAVLLGCDLFDSASYAKYARDGRLMFLDRTRKIGNIRELGCECPICTKYTAKELASGISALKALKKHKKYLERFESISKESAFRFISSYSLDRPLVYRLHERLVECYKAPKAKVLIEFPEGEKPYSRYYAEEIKKILEICDARFIVNSTFGPIPIELDEMYPIAQSIMPEDIDEVNEVIQHFIEEFAHNLDCSFKVVWDDESLGSLGSSAKGKATFNLDVARVKGVADFQFGRGASDILFKGKIELIKSRKTGKIRNVIVDGKHILSMRAHDGLFTLKAEGAKRLHKAFKFPKLRVSVHEDSAKYNQEGKNVFAKFVLDCDNDIRPMDEVLIVDEKDRLAAIGRALMNREEMLAFQKGIAVKVREGVN